MGVKMGPSTGVIFWLALVTNFVLSEANIFGCPCGDGKEGEKESRRRTKRESPDDGPAQEEKIVNGYAPNERAWLALLLYNEEGVEESSRCGGAVITKNFIITAAHCICNAENSLPCKAE